jgi:hypothetical protein
LFRAIYLRLCPLTNIVSFGFRFKRFRLRLRIVYREVFVVYSYECIRIVLRPKTKPTDETDTWPKPKPINDKQT